MAIIGVLGGVGLLVFAASAYFGFNWKWPESEKI